MSPALVLIAGGALLFALKGRRRRPWAQKPVFFIGPNCDPLTRPAPTTEAEVQALVSTLAQLTAQAMTNAGAPTSASEAMTYDGTEAALQRVLGPAPGDQETNLSFLRAYTLEMTRLLTHPSCVLSEDPAEWPDSVKALGEELFSSSVPIFAEHGYGVGVQFAMATATRRGLAHFF